MTLANLTHNDECAARRFAVFALEQAKRNIRNELELLAPFDTRRAEKHAELDQLDDMLNRRR